MHSILSPLKLTRSLVALLLAVAVGFAATRNTPGLPFGDLKITAPLQLETMPTPSFMPSPMALKAEFTKRKLSGEVLLGFTISTKGKPEKIKVLKSTSDEMAAVASAYLSKMVFKPARLGGKAVDSEAELPFFTTPPA